MSRRQKHPLRPLQDTERVSLTRLSRSGNAPAAQAARARALLAVAGGQNHAAARLARQRTGDTVARWVAAFNNSGLAAVVPRHGGGHPVCYGEAEQRRILAEVARPPDLDLERGRVVDVLPDRSAEGTARWLARHPGVEVISRDRCGLYAQGAHQGAPQARQVADRFHLLQNLRACIESHMSISRHHGRTLPAGAAPGAADASEVTRRQAQRDAHEALFERVQRLRADGLTMRAIAARTGVGWRTGTNWVRSGCLHGRNRVASGPRSPRRFQAYLKRRWVEGCTHGRYLFWEVCSGKFSASATKAATPTGRSSWPSGGAAAARAPGRSRNGRRPPQPKPGRSIPPPGGRSRRSRRPRWA